MSLQNVTAYFLPLQEYMFLEGRPMSYSLGHIVLVPKTAPELKRSMEN